MRTSKAYVKRSGFSRHCAVIASVGTEHLLQAMALHGEKADIRELLRSPEVDVSLKRALGSVLQVGASVLATAVKFDFAATRLAGTMAPRTSS